MLFRSTQLNQAWTQQHQHKRHQLATDHQPVVIAEATAEAEEASEEAEEAAIEAAEVAAEVAAQEAVAVSARVRTGCHSPSWVDSSR